VIVVTKEGGGRKTREARDWWSLAYQTLPGPMWQLMTATANIPPPPPPSPASRSPARQIRGSSDTSTSHMPMAAKIHTTERT
jgi:hypothetical protein